jgi:D-tyrosyl-tRNA(Tyr) deacylase
MGKTRTERRGAGPYTRPSEMRALVQRVSRAAVRVDERLVAEIGPGLLVLLGVTHADDNAAADRLAAKTRALRVFPDAHGHMNEALGEREILCVSQFTLYGDAHRGNRPSFIAAARSEQAEPLYERFCERAGAKRGVFGAQMAVELVNDGPVTLMLEA